MKKFNIETRVQDLLNYIIKNQGQMLFLRLISRRKPIATVASSIKALSLGGIGGDLLFLFYWKQFSDDEKTEFISQLTHNLPQSDLDLGINFNENPSLHLHNIQNIIFYSKPDFKRLCSIFDYTEEHGFSILRNVINDTNKKDLLFMWLAFGNLTSSVLSPNIPNNTQRYNKFKMDNIKISSNSSEKNIDYNDIHKMIFIFNALNDGWTVKKLDKDKFEFIKDKEQLKKEVVLEDCIKEFIKYNIVK
jgi:hypothetical protein